MNREERRKFKPKVRMIAEDIYELEKLIENNIDVEANQNKIEHLMMSLSFEEMLEVDNYIQALVTELE